MLLVEKTISMMEKENEAAEPTAASHNTQGQRMGTSRD